MSAKAKANNGTFETDAGGVELSAGAVVGEGVTGEAGICGAAVVVELLFAVARVSDGFG